MSLKKMYPICPCGSETFILGMTKNKRNDPRTLTAACDGCQEVYYANDGFFDEGRLRRIAGSIDQVNGKSPPLRPIVTVRKPPIVEISTIARCLHMRRNGKSWKEIKAKVNDTRSLQSFVALMKRAFRTKKKEVSAWLVQNRRDKRQSLP